MMALIRASLLLVATFLVFALASPAAEAFDIFGGACSGSAASSAPCQQANKQTGEIQNNPISGKHGALQRATTLLAIIGGLAAVIIIIIGGIMFVTSGGRSDEGAKNARTLITNGVVGLVIIALAWTLVSFIIQRVVG